MNKQPIHSDFGSKRLDRGAVLSLLHRSGIAVCAAFLAPAPVVLRSGEYDCPHRRPGSVAQALAGLDQVGPAGCTAERRLSGERFGVPRARYDGGPPRCRRGRSVLGRGGRVVDLRALARGGTVVGNHCALQPRPRGGSFEAALTPPPVAVNGPRLVAGFQRAGSRRMGLLRVGRPHTRRCKRGSRSKAWESLRRAVSMLGWRRALRRRTHAPWMRRDSRRHLRRAGCADAEYRPGVESAEGRRW